MRLLSALSRSFSWGVSESMPPALMRSSRTSSSACSSGVGPPWGTFHGPDTTVGPVGRAAGLPRPRPLPLASGFRELKRVGALGCPGGGPIG